MKAKMHLAFDLSYDAYGRPLAAPGSWTGRTFPDLGV